MQNIKTIVKKLKEGKKIRRKTWQEGHYWRLDIKGNLCEGSGKVLNNWEVLEEDDWNLANNSICFDRRNDPNSEIYSKVCTTITLEKLKAKILEDINKEVNENNGMTIAGTKYIFDILDKRFGF